MIVPGAETTRTPYGAGRKFIDDVALGYAGDDCLIWPYSRGSWGYAAQVRVKGRQVSAHRIVCELAHGVAPTPTHEVAHSCGRGHDGCVNPRHLRWATHAENMRDRFVHGTVPNGKTLSRTFTTKLKDEDVSRIRSLRGVISATELAKQYKVSQSLISRIHHNRLWKWLEEGRAE